MERDGEFYLILPARNSRIFWAYPQGAIPLGMVLIQIDAMGEDPESLQKQS